MKSALCFGYGYVAKAWGARLQAEGWDVTGTSRHPSPSSARLVVFDGSAPVPREELYQHTHILISIPPDKEGDPTWRAHKEVLGTHPNLQWLGYLSSTSVYGDHAGAWVYESSDCHPSDTICQNRLLAEEQWLQLYQTHDLPVHIFRLAGIYGRGRSIIDRIKAGTAQRIHKPGQYFSRTHVDDIVNVLLASMNRPNPGSVYNVADDEPCSPQVLIEYACDQLHLPYPPLLEYATADLSPMVKHFYQDNRRISNGKIKHELGVRLIYPTYREGLSREIKSFS